MPQLVVAAAYYIGTYLVNAYVGYALAAAVSYGIAKNQQRKAERNAIAAYNAGLSDRMQMLDLTPGAAGQLVLGRVRSVEGIRRRWTSGTHDEQLTLVISYACHEIDGFEKFFWADIELELNEAGWAQTAPFLKAGKASLHRPVTIGPGGTAIVVADGAIAPGTISANIREALLYPEVAFAVVGNTITVTGTPGAEVDVHWQQATGRSTLRIRTWRGAEGQNVGADLAAEYPGKITATDRFAGMAVAVVDLFYDPDVYPQGLQSITALMRGARIRDPRTGTTAFTENPALHAQFLATHPLGWALQAEDLRESDVIAAANVCDPATEFTLRKQDGSTELVTLPRYRCGITIDTSGDPRAAMDEIMESMAGRWGWAGGVWRFRAGHSAAPVFAMDASWIARLVDADGTPRAGNVVRLVNGIQREDKVNAITGVCVDPDQRWLALPFPAVKDAVLIGAQGEYPAEVELQGVNHIAHAQHLSAIRIRENQAGLRMEASCNLSAWRCELFDVGAVTLPRYGFDAKPFEVTSWRWHPTEGVQLGSAETSAAIYEPAELAGRDPAPNSGLPAMFSVPELGLLEPESGTVHLLKLQDGTILSRMLVKWSPVVNEAVRAGGRVEIRYGRVDQAPELWQTLTAPGDDTQLYIDGVQDGRYYLVMGRTHNGLVGGRWSNQRAHRVLGKLQAPAAVAGLALSVVPGALKGSRTPSTELDYGHTLYRYGASFASGTPVPGTSDASGFAWLSPPLGPIVIWAADVDTSGNIGPAVSAYANVDARALIEGGNLIDLSWWRRDAAIPWATNAEYNRIISVYPSAGADVNVAGPKGGNDLVWYAEEQAGNGDSGGGWHAVPLSLDPTQTYRFVVPLRRHSGSAGSMWWGTGNIENLNGEVLDYSDYGLGLTSANPNPYFIGSKRPEHTDRWYLAVGYIYPASSMNNTHETAGLWDCKTGERVSDGFNYRFKAGDGHVIHRAYQFYASLGAQQLFGRPLVSLVDGTEPGLREYFEAGAVLNSTLVPVIAAAQGAADAAQAAANAAAVNATAALGRLAIAESNGYYDRGEKPSLLRDWQAIYDEQTPLYAEASTYGIVAERNAYVAAIDALAAYLNSLSPWWSDTSVDTPIVPAVSQAAWAAVYAARATLRRRISEEAGKVAQWPGVAGRPKSFKVGANGLSAVSPPIGAALYNAETGGLLLDGAAMYRVAKIHRTTQAVTDVGGWNTLAGGGNPAAMAAALNAIGSDHIVVVYSYDEPQGGRLTGGLLEAMLRHGASRAVFGSPAFRYRAAYILVAIGGCGEGNGAECYAGEVDADPNAWCELGFQLHNGVLTVSGTTSGARSLTDYGYVGDLNATLNEVIYSPTAPASPTERMTWIDTSVTPRTIKVRVGGVWQLAGTYVNGTAQIADDANLGLTALWIGVAGSGKPADNATRNQVYFQDTDPVSSPGGVVDGAIWISSTKARQRVSGAWQPYVGAGSVDTDELADGAATDVLTALLSDSGDFTGMSGNYHTVLTRSYTPDADCTIEATVTGECYLHSGYGLSGTSYAIALNGRITLDTAETWDFTSPAVGAVGAVPRTDITPTTNPFAITREFDLVAGVPVTFTFEVHCGVTSSDPGFPDARTRRVRLKLIGVKK